MADDRTLMAQKIADDERSARTLLDRSKGGGYTDKQRDRFIAQAQVHATLAQVGLLTLLVANQGSPVAELRVTKLEKHEHSNSEIVTASGRMTRWGDVTSISFAEREGTFRIGQKVRVSVAGVDPS